MTIELPAVAEIQLVYKSNLPVANRIKIRSSKEAYDLLLQSWDENKIDFIEQAKVLLLNRANDLLGIYTVSTGGCAATYIDPKLVFIAALKANASSIVLAHNHPSGNLKASRADLELTRVIQSAGSFLELPLRDHMIITSENYYSFADNGLI